MKIYEKIQTLRAELTNLDIKKSGKNAFAKFNYYTLDDFIPTVNQLMAKHKLFTVFNMDKEMATLTVYDSESEESVQFTTPVASAGDKIGTPVQALGAIHTYLKRYLYMNFLELTEGDVLDSVLGDPKLEKKEEKKTTKVDDIKNTITEPISAEQIKTIYAMGEKWVIWIKTKADVEDISLLTKDEATEYIGIYNKRKSEREGK